MKDLIIVGSGGFAREVEWLVGRINHVIPTWNFKGFIDKDLGKPDVVGNDDYVVNCQDELYVAIAIGDSGIREAIYKKYRNNPKIQFANLIDPSVVCSDKIRFGEGNIICAGTIITVDVSIGDCNIINLDCTIGHDAVLDDYVTMNPSVNISGNTHLRAGCNIGTGTQIIQGISVGRNTVVGAGAVVTRDLPDNCVAVGVPAKVKRTRNSKYLSGSC